MTHNEHAFQKITRSAPVCCGMCKQLLYSIVLDYVILCWSNNFKGFDSQCGQLSTGSCAFSHDIPVSSPRTSGQVQCVGICP